MTEEYSKILRKTFPDLVSRDFYFEIEDGWYQLVYDLFTNIQSHCTATGEKVKMLQVKEKFGGLRVYYNHEGSENDSNIFNLVMEAQNKSYSTCEITGGAGHLHKRGLWVKTLCKESAILLEYKDTKNIYGNV